MPIKIESNMPVIKKLEEESIFVMPEDRAVHQDIRELRIAIINLMSNKEATELQLLRLLSNSPLQLEISFIRLATHKYKNVSASYLNTYYKLFDTIKDTRFNGLIITGAPVEKLEYEQVDYLDELAGIMEWSKTHVTSSLYICWAAQAGLYYHYGIPKYEFDKKLSGIYLHRLTDKTEKLVRGFDDEFFAPHSRYTGIHTEEIRKHKELNILAESKTAGAYIISDGKNIFVNGHPGYDADTLAGEYIRDTNLKLSPALPANYFPNNDPHETPIMRWRSQGNLLFSNWLNYYVYQITPFDLGKTREQADRLSGIRRCRHMKPVTRKLILCMMMTKDQMCGMRRCWSL